MPFKTSACALRLTFCGHSFEKSVIEVNRHIHTRETMLTRKMAMATPFSKGLT